MSRHKKSPEMLKSMCARLCTIMDEHLRLNARELAKALGYSSPTILSSVRSGGSFLDVEKLIKLAAITTGDGMQVNLHWLLTGEGNPLMPRPLAPAGLDTGAAASISRERALALSKAYGEVAKALSGESN